jgi:predicted secreted hydrolase
LTLRAAKPVVAHGDRGLSQKSAQPGNASYYLSFTRLATEGQATVGGQPASVTGESWFDHEWSTSALGTDIVGWDWFALQLDDGRELMFYQFRRADGSLGPLSAGTLVQPDGSAIHLKASDVQIETLATWPSPESQGVYPSRWRVVIPSAQIDLTVEPWLAEQEMRVSFPYWEGAVRARGTSGGAAVSGNGYVELTGYVSSMQGVF